MKILKFDAINESKKRGDNTLLKVDIDGEIFQEKEASETFFKVVDFIATKVGKDKFIDGVESRNLGKSYIFRDESSFPSSYRAVKRSNVGDFYISAHSSTKTKKDVLDGLISGFSLNGKVEVVEGRRKFEPSKSISNILNNDIKKVKEVDTISDQEIKMTFIEAAQYILKKNENKPMTGFEVWKQSEDIIETTGKTPWDTMNSQMILYSENSTAKGKKKNSLFRIQEGTKPYRFILINPELEIQSIPDSDESKEEENSINRFSSFRKVVNPFGAESTKNGHLKNTSAICVLGKSGAGKTYRIEKTLKKEGHKMELIIPSASTTNLLVQYKSGEYVTSRLGKFILEANKDKSNFYTAVFDECHKYIDMINDELLQCISTKRNDGLRFISLDPVTDELFNELPEKNGRRIIPDNLGFIFISSKEEIIRNNSDFYNRVDIITIDKSDRDLDFALEIIKNKIEESDEEFTNE